MSRATLILAGPAQRAKAIEWVQKVEPFTVVEFRRPRRTLEQNALMWALLTDLSQQVEWYGRHLTPENWKDVCTAALREADVVPGITKHSFVVLGQRTSSMTKEELSDVIELIRAFGAEHNVTFTDPNQGAQP